MRFRCVSVYSPVDQSLLIGDQPIGIMRAMVSPVDAIRYVQEIRKGLAANANAVQ